MERVVTREKDDAGTGGVHDDCSDSSNNLPDLCIHSIKARSFLIFDPRNRPRFRHFSSFSRKMEWNATPLFCFHFFPSKSKRRGNDSGKWTKSYLLPRFARIFFFFFYPIPVDLVGGVDHTAACNVTHEEASRIIILP